MTLLGYEFEFSNRAKRAFNDLKVFRRSNYTHIVWYKFSLIFGQTRYCEECEVKTEIGQDLCDECHSNIYCECGKELESKGDGFCRTCD